MPILISQEKNLTIFLLSTALIGSVIGIYIHNWLKTPEILLSPKNLLSLIKEIEEEAIIDEHNAKIRDQLQKSDLAEKNIEDVFIQSNNNIFLELSQEVLLNNDSNKIKSDKKKITQNTSGIININIASEEDFMKLPYIGEVKAERIIQLRNEMGMFVSIKDLEKVQGIGQKTFTKIEPFITI